MKSSVEDLLNLNHYVNFGNSGRDLLLVLGAAAALALLFAIWAVFIRKRPDTGPYTLHEGAVPERRRRRRSRRSIRRNPTLAETGGLPPVRSNQHIEV